MVGGGGATQARRFDQSASAPSSVQRAALGFADFAAASRVGLTMRDGAYTFLKGGAKRVAREACCAPTRVIDVARGLPSHESA